MTSLFAMSKTDKIKKNSVLPWVRA